METLDKAEETLTKLILGFDSNRKKILTEEDAKIQLINEMLFGVLGWKPRQLSAERKHPSGYSDYLVGNPENPEFVIEAKRLGLLELQLAQVNRQRSLKLSGAAFKSITKEISQARGYADDCGLPFSVLTDGNAWIIIRTSVPGKNFLDAEAFVFPSLGSVKNSFPLFFDLLSPDQVRLRVFRQCFDEIHNPRVLLEQTLRAPFEDGEINLGRKSDLAFDLDRVFDRFFGKMRGDDDPDLLIECFVETRESRIADFSLEKITARILGNISSGAGTVDDRLARLVEAAIEVDEGQTVFIIGPTGSGKTTFVDRFFRKTLNPSIRQSCIDVRISCLDAGGAGADISVWAVEAMIESLEQKLFDDGHPSYEHLKGMYYREYSRRRDGVGAALYQQDKSAFQIEFGNFLSVMVEQDREGYLKRLLADIVNNRGKLPVLIVDNIDEFSQQQKEALFQLAQALRRYAKHAMVIFPITDKSAWSFSKSDIFGIYKSKSFFLPTPSPRDIFSKRIEYLRGKLDSERKGKARGDYFLSKGIRVSIDNLEGFAGVLESVFISQENTAKTLGELTNYNIRRTLELARRVMTSSVFDVDELIAAYVSGQPIATDYNRFLLALMKGDYQLYRPHDGHMILPVYQVDSRFKQTPLLALRVLSLLEATSEGGRSVEDKHASIQSIVDYFDALGIVESSVAPCLKSLLAARLIEPFDMSDLTVNGKLNVAITHSGRIHLNLASRSRVFIEQMALTTGIADESVSDELSAIYLGNGPILERLDKVRRTFVEYLVREDSVYVSGHPKADRYENQEDLLRRLKAQLGRGTQDSNSRTSWTHLTGLVDWFSEEKGYGFVDVSGISGQVFLHIETVKASGIAEVTDGDDLLCDVERLPKGLAISKIHRVSTDPDVIERVVCEVVKIIPERGYGFVAIEGYDRDAFFHFSSLSTNDLPLLNNDSRFEAEIRRSVDGSTAQVRKITRFL